MTGVRGRLAAAVTAIEDAVGLPMGLIVLAPIAVALWIIGGCMTFTGTAEAAPTAQTDSITLDSRTSTTIRICWQNITSGASYQVDFRRTGNSTWASYGVSPIGCLTFNALLAGTSYDFRVLTYYDQEGAGPSTSGTYSFYTLVNSPTGLASPDQTNTSVTVSWTAPGNGGSPITGFEVRYQPTSADDDDWTEWRDDIAGDATSLEVTSLLASTEYRFQVAGVNANGQGPWSASLIQGTKYPPEQVSGLILTSANTTRLSVFWSESFSRYAITGYRLQHRLNTTPAPAWTSVSLPAGQTSYTITGLTAGSAYEVWVRAMNQDGYGPWSETLFVSTNADLFATASPDNFMVMGSGDSTTMVGAALSWDAVTGSDSYQIERSVDGTISFRTTTEEHFEDTYTKDAAASGNLTYRVRGSKVVSGQPQYTPWSASASLLFYGTGSIANPQILQEEMAGNRALPAEIIAARAGLGTAIDGVAETTGFTVDTDGAIQLLSLLPGLVILALSVIAGITYRQLPLALAFGTTLFTMSLYAASAIWGTPIIWPILITVFVVMLGILALARRVGWV